MKTIPSTRDEALASLHQSVCRVVFTKKDGTSREMYATLISMFLPKVDPATVTEGSAPAQKKPSQSKSIPVWDMDKKDWRSINLDTITEWEQLVTPDPVI